MSANYNKFKLTTVYGNFQNSDLDQNNTSNANAIFDRNMLVSGTLQVNDCSFNTISLNGDISCNSLTITPIEISYLKDVSSNIQSQFNDISNNYIKNLVLSNYVTSSSLTTTLSNYTNTIDLSNNYIKNSALSNYVTNNSLTSTLSSYATNSSVDSKLSSYATNSSVDSKLSSYATNSSLNSKLSDYVFNDNFIIVYNK
jgi:hypothetical protein